MTPPKENLIEEEIILDIYEDGGITEEEIIDLISDEKYKHLSKSRMLNGILKLNEKKELYKIQQQKCTDNMIRFIESCYLADNEYCECSECSDTV